MQVVFPLPPEDKSPLLKLILKIFRIIGTRDEKGHAYEPLGLAQHFKPAKLLLYSEFRSFFKAILTSAGLQMEGVGEELRVIFSIRYPLYVYTRLSESFTLLTVSEEFLKSGEWWDNEWDF